jgi:long-chain acyl-CoA synthetase
MNVANMFEESVVKFGEFDTCYYDGRWYTNLEMNKMANRFGNGLKKLGIKRGDRVVTKISNCIEVLVAFNAIYRIGAVVIPMIPALRQEQATYILKDSGARAIITSSDHLASIQAAQKEAPELKHVILADKDGMSGTVYFHRLLADNSDQIQIEEMENDELAAMIYTSGTTGNPKGVMHTHFGLWLFHAQQAYTTMTWIPATLQAKNKFRVPQSANIIEADQKVTGVDRNATYLLVLPLSHVAGIGNLGYQVFTGGRYVVMKAWSPAEVLKTIHDFHIAVLVLVPAMYVMLMNHPDFDKYDLSSLQVCISGAARMEPETGLAWKARTGLDIFESWGMTETCGGFTCNPYDRPPKYGSIGIKMSQFNRIAILDNYDREVAQGQTGEICVKGPSIMKGYWNMPEETASTLKSGWLHTGDVGHIDQDGFVYITDRKKDLIIRGGENVSPSEVEEVICKHLKVLEAACVGVPDKVYGEEIKAFVVLRKGENCTEAEIIEHCRPHLPKFKMPKQVQFIDAIPRNTMGKPLRRELRKPA